MRFPESFDSPALDGETLTLEVDGFTVMATIHDDPDSGPPWKEHDCHGWVTRWTSRDKAPGELVLNEDHGSRRFYDFAGAVRLARRDGWGAKPYRMDIEDGVPSGGLVRANGQWFKGRDLVSGVSDWCDDKGEAIRQAYDRARDAVGPGEWAAMAARSDFEYLKAWCDDEWSWVGVAVTVSRAGVDLTGEYDHAIWGVDSPSADHLTELANERIGEALDSARAKISALSAA